MKDTTVIAAALFAAAMCLAQIAVHQGNRIASDAAYPPLTTVGYTNAAVTQDNLASTVCVSGWTKTIRPPASYTDKLKREQMTALGLPGTPGDYEEDHFISLEIGGNPIDPRNLWPEPYAGPYGARVKDQVEDAMHRELCAGRMSLDDVQSCITSDWVACGIAHHVKALSK